jgi:hypothetical protein
MGRARFNHRKIKELSLVELQADEIRTIVGGKELLVWVFVVIDVWSRLWLSTVGRQTKLSQHSGPVSRRFKPDESRNRPLIATDGFKFYERVIGRVFGPACFYGQVIKMRRNDRVGRVEGRAVIGAGRLRQALRDSEDSAKLDTSFVERLNLTFGRAQPILDTERSVRSGGSNVWKITSNRFATITISSGFIGP